MSFLNTLKTVAAQKAAQLSYPHALHTWPVETRQRYLAAVAAGTAVDRDVQPIEKETFYTLASNLGLSDQDAAEQLSGRASLAEHDVHHLFGILLQLKLGPLFLFDLACLHVADSELCETETQVGQIFADLLQVEAAVWPHMCDFALALKQRQREEVIRLSAHLPKDEILRSALPGLLKVCFPEEAFNLFAPVLSTPGFPEMVLLPAGRFEMGSNDYSDEQPVHTVSLPAFAIGRYPVTFDEFDLFVSQTAYTHQPVDIPDWGRGKRPVIDVSWEDAQAYCLWLSQQTGDAYRLPSEAEWEYACRAGGKHTYSGSDDIDSVAWYDDNSDVQTHPVGEKQANAFGLHDMSGNVWEWVEDVWHESYAGAPTNGRAWLTGDAGRRVLRGGSWNNDARDVRSANRYGGGTGFRNVVFGFRVAFSPARTH
jgi:formylglycine-generating enzyme required for sulfatase activity